MPEQVRFDAPGKLHHVIVGDWMGVALAEVAQRVGVSSSAVSKIIQKDSQLVNSVNNVPEFGIFLLTGGPMDVTDFS